jgi:hypothetical protein
VSKDPEVVNKAYVIAREASEVTSRGQGKVRRLHWRLKFMLGRSKARSVGDVLSPDLGAR